METDGDREYTWRLGRMLAHGDRAVGVGFSEEVWYPVIRLVRRRELSARTFHTCCVELEESFWGGRNRARGWDRAATVDGV